jgi:hypothetical protein
MARFDLSKYATVAERIQLLYAEYPDARIVTENLTTAQDRAVLTWVVKASLYLSVDDQLNKLPKATGHAFEIDGGSGANATSALENAESSAVGRCLALAGWAANKEAGSLASREEMQKVERGVIPTGRNFLAEADEAALKYNLDALRLIYADARSAKTDAVTLEKIEAYARELKQL